ncbi:MAG: WD40/YVTN/BNR-like repeat-containing protein [Thermoleophilia bacterium]
MRQKALLFLACLALLGALATTGCVPGESPTPTIPADTPEPEQPSWLRIYTDVAFSGPSLGLISGWRGNIMRSDDGGQTWSKVQVPTEADLNSIAILDAKTAVAVGSSGNILRSVDGGLTWEKATSPTSDTLNAVAPISGGSAVAVGWHGTIIKTTDGGKTWASSSPSNDRSLNFESVDFTPDGTGMAVSSTGQVYKTTNSADWQQLTLPDADIKLFTVDLYDPYTALTAGNIEMEKSFAFGGKTVILKTADGGQHWEFGPRNQNVDLLAIHFIDSQNAVTTGWDGMVFLTGDSGQTWAPSVSHTKQALRAIAIVDTGTIIAVGDGQTIIRSKDGGFTWEKIEGA